MTERWVHFSDKSIAAVEDRGPHDEAYRYWKPRGLWVSDENDKHSWAAWCASERFRDCQKQLAYEVILAPGANILRMNCRCDLRAFSEQFHLDSDDRYTSRSIDWPRVMDAYDGILITPYQWDSRLEDDTFWYYGWDCASGCIWKASAVESLRQIEAEQFAHHWREECDA